MTTRWYENQWSLHRNWRVVQMELYYIYNPVTAILENKEIDSFEITNNLNKLHRMIL